MAEPRKIKSRWRSLALRLAGALIVLLLLAIGASWLADPAPTAAEVQILTPPESIFIGTSVICATKVTCPLYRLPLTFLNVVAPAGAQALPENSRRWCGLGVLSWRWKLTFVLQPYELGPKKDGKVEVALSPGRGASVATLSGAIPEFTVRPSVADDETVLRLAPRLSAAAVPVTWRWWHYAALAGAVLLLALVTWWFLRRKKEAAVAIPIPPWDAALMAMQVLEGRLPLEPATFFVSLIDLLRSYCEAREFAAHATATTTPEFLEAVHRNPALSVAQKQALREFLTAADLIKFAKAEATQEQLVDALRAGRRFVAETTPQPAAVSAVPKAAHEPSPKP